VLALQIRDPPSRQRGFLMKKKESNCQTKKFKMWSSVPKGARHKTNLPTDRPSQCTSNCSSNGSDCCASRFRPLNTKCKSSRYTLDRVQNGPQNSSLCSGEAKSFWILRESNLIPLWLAWLIIYVYFIQREMVDCT
jgi:hypothetical protein